MIKNFIPENIQYSDVKSYLYYQQYKNLVRFTTCGSVDDGKSTLIGRLLYDTRQIYDDQLCMLHNNKSYSSCNNKLNLASLVDGLRDERIQGITIDVAYRYFSTNKCKFIISDAPGHIQYTRNMVTAVSNSDVVILLVDVRKGIREQTKRHSFISVLLGIRHIVVAINKMDLVSYDQNIFYKIQEDYLNFSRVLSADLDIKFIPLSALDGDNVTQSSANMSWYDGDTLLNILENIQLINANIIQQPLRFPVQYIMHFPDLDFRGYAGTVASGRIYVGQSVQITASSVCSKINRIVTFNKDIMEAYAGNAITVVLSDDVDISRGDILTDIDQNLFKIQTVLADVIWMSDRELLAGQIFDIKIANKKSCVCINSIKYKVDINNLSRYATDNLSLNNVGLVELLFSESLLIDKYCDNHITGGMIFIDQLSNNTVGVGMVRELLLRHDNKKVYSDFELALNKLICLYFPHWKARSLLEDMDEEK